MDLRTLQSLLCIVLYGGGGALTLKRRDIFGDFDAKERRGWRGIRIDLYPAHILYLLTPQTS
jgi:hypothetical protein